MKPLRFATHSKLVQDISTAYGWLPAARYTNLRDVRTFDKVGFIDIDWKSYDFGKHLAAVKLTRPMLTVAKDWMEEHELPRIIDNAYELAEHAERVIIVPKVVRLKYEMENLIPEQFLFGFSTPSKYGGTEIEPEFFRRPVHLLGGSPARQLDLAEELNVHSFDCNRFTLDARFGDFFDGARFRPHPVGGYRRCIEDSIESINAAWLAKSANGKDVCFPSIASVPDAATP